jgi:hypothetical protein
MDRFRLRKEVSTTCVSRCIERSTRDLPLIHPLTVLTSSSLDDSTPNKKEARPSVSLNQAEPRCLTAPCAFFGNLFYAVNDEPQPQLPVAFGFVNVKPEPITLVT